MFLGQLINVVLVGLMMSLNLIRCLFMFVSVAFIFYFVFVVVTAVTFDLSAQEVYFLTWRGMNG